MRIAWNRIFVTRKAVEARGRFRIRYLPDGQRVRLLKRLGRGLYVSEPVPALSEVDVAILTGEFERWAQKNSLSLAPAFQVVPSSHIGPVHVSTACVGNPCTNPAHFHLHGSEIVKVTFPWTKPDA